MAGDVADGLIGHPIQSLRWIDEVVVDAFETGLSVARAATVPTSITCRRSAARSTTTRRWAIWTARRTISFYATVKTYMPLWEMHGFGENAVEGGRRLPPRRPGRGPCRDQRRDGRHLLCRRPPGQGPGPGRGNRRARRRPLPHAADLFHLAGGVERVPEPPDRRLRPRRLGADGPETRRQATLIGPSTAKQRCWSGSWRIPEGLVATYGDVSPGAPRFAGSVLFGAVEPDLPWWRVVRADGSLAKGGAPEAPPDRRGRPDPRGAGRPGGYSSRGVMRNTETTSALCASGWTT